MFNNYASLAEGIVLFSSILCRTIPRKTHNAFTEEQVPGQPAVHVGSSNPLRDAVQDRSQSWMGISGIFFCTPLGSAFPCSGLESNWRFPARKMGVPKINRWFLWWKISLQWMIWRYPQETSNSPTRETSPPWQCKRNHTSNEKKIRYLVANYPWIVSGLQPWL